MTLRVKDGKTGELIAEYHYKDATIGGGSVVIARGDEKAIAFPASDVIVTADEDDHIFTIGPGGNRVKIR